MDLLVSILVLFILAGVYFYRKKKHNLPPGPWSWPLSDVFIRDESPWITFKEWAKEYGPVVRGRDGFKDLIVIDDATILRDAFNERAFSGRSVHLLVSTNHFSGGKDITFSEGETWTEIRRFVVKTLKEFGFGKKSMEFLIMEEVHEFLQWMKRSGESPIDVSERFTLAAANSLWTLISGQRHEQDDPFILNILDKFDAHLNPDTSPHPLLIKFPILAEYLPSVFLPKWNNYAEGRKAYTNIFKKARDNHVQTVGESTPKDLIEAILQQIQKTTNKGSSFYKENGYRNLTSVIGDFYGAAATTTPSALSWALTYLVLYPEYQRKFQMELDRVIGRDRVPTLTDRSNLPFTEALTMEILRHSSIIPLGIFHKALEDTRINGFDVKKGSTVVGNLYSIHYNEKYWGDPENFRPERFLSPEDPTRVIKSEYLMAFGTGKRQCPGESLARDTFFLFLTNIFQKYQICPDPTQPPSLDIKPSFFRETNNYRVILKEQF